MAAKKAKKATSKRAGTTQGRAAKKTAKKAAAKKQVKARRNEVVHWEIQSQNPEQLHEFYAEALSWTIDTDNPMNYGMVASGGRSGINGGIGGSPSSGSRVIVYASVPSIPRALRRIESLGGKTVMPRTVAGPVTMALYQDPEGNTMGLIEE